MQLLFKNTRVNVLKETTPRLDKPIKLLSLFENFSGARTAGEVVTDVTSFKSTYSTGSQICDLVQVYLLNR